MKIADFPKTHSLRELLTDFSKAYKKEKEIAKIKKEKDNEIADLEEAYITSRYLPAEFTETQIKNMRKFNKELIKFLRDL